MTSILFINPSSDLYGADRSLLRTVRAIQKNEDVNIIVCLPYDGPLVIELEKLGVEIRIFPMAVMRRKYFTFLGILDWGFALIRAYFKLLAIVKREKVTLIHSNASSVFVGGLVAKTIHIPHLWHLREIIVSPKLVKKFVASLYSHLATKVIGVSNSTIEHLQLDVPDIYKKSITINNGIDLSDYDFKKKSRLREEIGVSDDQILIGMVARVSFWKGQDIFTEMAKQVSLKSPNVHFLALGSAFSGQEHLMDAFQQRVSDAGLSEIFTICEFDPDTSKYLSAFDIFILPSKNPDPFPTTVLEAMAAGKPIVANGHGGVLDMIVDGEEGLIVKPNDIVKLTEAVVYLVENQEARDKLGKNAQDKLHSHFTFEHYQQRISRLFLQYIH